MGKFQDPKKSFKLCKSSSFLSRFLDKSFMRLCNSIPPSSAQLTRPLASILKKTYFIGNLDYPNIKELKEDFADA